MKNIILLLICLNGFLVPAFAQTYVVAGDTVTENPLANSSDLFDSKELVLLWDERNTNNNTFPIRHQIVDYLQNTAGTVPLNQAFSFKNVANTPNQTNAGSRRLDIATGDFNGDGFQEYVTAWTSGNGNGISFFVPKMDHSVLDPTNGVTQQVSVSMGTNDDNLYGKVRIMAGDLDGDARDEIILLYPSVITSGPNGVTSLALKVFFTVQNGPGSISFVETTNTNVFDLVNNQPFEPWDVVVADFDLDGNKEIAVAGLRKPPGGGVPAVNMYVYNCDSTTRGLQSKGLETIRTNIPAGTTVSVNMTAGDFDDKVGNELAIAVSTPGASASGQSINDTYLYLVRIGDELGVGSYDLLEAAFYGVNDLSLEEYSQNVPSSFTMNAFDLESGDLDNDGRDELVIGLLGKFKALRFVPGTGWNEFAEVGGFSMPDPSYSYNFLSVGDLDNDRRAEIVYVQDYKDENTNPETYKLVLQVYRWNGSAFEKKAETTNHQSIQSGQSEPRRFALAIGDFDGDRVRVGQGRRYVKTKIVQPLVILNAPPVQFDILGNTTVDLNTCYNGQNCDFRSIYKTSSSSTELVSTTVERTWGVSASLSGGGTFAGLGVEASVTAKYGEKFSRSGVNSKTFTISQQTVAKEDDWIYATVTDYIIWEYPVFEAGNLVGNLLSLTPVLSENRWFDSKSWSAYTYQPDHEVGNILSYRPYAQPNFTDNPAVQEPIKADAIADALTVSINSDHTWDLNIQDFNQNSASKTKEIGLEVGASISGWGVKVGVTGNYSQSSLSTHTTSVQNSTSLTVELKGVDPSVPEARYIVTPYMYWGKNGSLTLDYAVRPEEAAPGGTPTFWDANYKNVADPAFILPWKYDPEKGFALQDPQKRYQTKSIFLDPVDPKIGEVVTITAYIYNWSLQPTNGPVSIGFFLGNPNIGGIPMTNTQGEQIVSTLSSIPGRSKEKITFQWVYDGNTTRFPKIYGYIDPGQAHTEIHENNNVGFVVLEVQGDGSAPLSLDEDMDGLEWVAAYPNPFSGQTNLEFELNTPQGVSLQVMDLQGRTVFQREKETLQPGTQSIAFAPDHLPAGIYLYRLSAGTRVAAGKLVYRP